jgi:hypothetical protein
MTPDFKKVLSELYDEKHDYYINNELQKNDQNYVMIDNINIITLDEQQDEIKTEQPQEEQPQEEQPQEEAKTEPLNIRNVVTKYSGNISYSGSCDGLFNVFIDKKQINDDQERVACFINFSPPLFCTVPEQKIYLDIPEDFKPNCDQDLNNVDFYYNDLHVILPIEVNDIVTINSPAENGLFMVGDKLGFISYIVYLEWVRNL